MSGKDLNEIPIKDLNIAHSTCTTKKDASLRSVVDMLKEKKIGCVLITEDDTPIGIFTERDFLTKIGFNETLAHEPIEKFMTKDPLGVQEDEPVFKALLMMRMGRFRHVIVVNQDNKLVNVLSIKDLMDFLCDKMFG
jgi:CBS domain-containing protein